jgi:prepilin-type processing-associated H-X9-DG protein
MSLVETVIVLAVGAILVSLSSAAVSSISGRTKNVRCLSRLRTLGTGVVLYSRDNNGDFPRSLHSAAGAGKTPWGKAILPYIGLAADPPDSEWERVFNVYYRCPADKNTSSNLWSYALNVYFELTPDGDDYEGSPATWRKVVNVDRPGATILMAEPKSVFYADHIMCHQWTSAKGATNAIDRLRHGGSSNYLFVDGHAEALSIGATYDPGNGMNRWNPALAK